MGSEFIPHSDSDTYLKVSGYLSTTNDIFTAPVNIPHGAVITKLVEYFYDNVATQALSVFLYRNDRIGGSSGTMALISVNTNLAGWRSAEDTTIAGATVDNDNYVYRVYVDFSASDADIRLGSIKIEYTVTNPLPQQSYEK